MNNLPSQPGFASTQGQDFPPSSYSAPKKHIFPIIFVIMGMILGLVVTLYQNQTKKSTGSKAAATGVTLSFSTTSPSVNTGDQVALNILLDTGTDTVSAADVTISYPQNKLEGVSFTAGTFLPVVLTPAKIEPGKAHITLGSQPTDAKKGSGIVATLTLRALQSGSAKVGFDPKTQVAAIGKNTNAVGTMTPIQITIQQGRSQPTQLPAIQPDVINTNPNSSAADCFPTFSSACGAAKCHIPNNCNAIHESRSNGIACWRVISCNKP